MARHTTIPPVSHQLITRMPGRNRDGTRTDFLVVAQLLEHPLRHARAHPKRRRLRPERRVAQEERTSTRALMPRAMGAPQRLRLRAMLRAMGKNTLAKKHIRTHRTHSDDMRSTSEPEADARWAMAHPDSAYASASHQRNVP
ncbi:hypothetical protein N7491_006486 [Penicillium cf. griseofulvum]|nr:hypothetical protein N7491_006486 [Penicillium cf. griseofulvum]